MAQRAAASFGQKKEPETATVFASLTAADIIRAPMVERRIAVDFLPLLKPYKKAGRLSLRIERLPQGGKFSAGRRSEDNSWSLGSDELEDLHFLISSNVARAHEITVRIMAVADGDISTVKVQQYVIAAGASAEPIHAGRDPHGQEPASPNPQITSPQTVSPQTVSPQISHQQAPSHQTPSPHIPSPPVPSPPVPSPPVPSQPNETHALLALLEAELIELRGAFERVTSEKETELAKARSDWELEAGRKITDAVAQARVQNRQDELKAETIAAEREQAKADSERRLQTERQIWQSESARRVEAARQELKLEAGRTLEAARQAWAAESEERKRAEIESLKAESERRIEAERQKSAAEASEHAAKVRDLLKSDVDQRLEVARQMWQAQADERRTLELESWKTDTEKRIAAERETWAAQAGEHVKAAFEREKVQTESRFDAERRNWKIAADAHAKKERERWEADAEQRMEAARRASWTEAQALLATERTRLETQVEQQIAAERQRLSSENTSAVGPVDPETAEKLAEERGKNRQISTALLAAADKNQELEAALAAMTQAYESAAQAAAEPPAPNADDGYIRGLREEIANLRQSIVDQAAELGKAHAELEQSRPLHIQREFENKKIGSVFHVREEENPAAAQAKSKALIRDAMLVAGLVIPLVLFYPWIAVYLPDGVRSGIAAATGGMLSVEIVAPPRPKISEAPAPAPDVKRPTVTADRVLNVRATPATTGTVLASLQKDTAVAVLQKQGNWTQIELPAEGAGKPQQGWVWNAYLQAKDN